MEVIRSEKLTDDRRSVTPIDSYLLQVDRKFYDHRRLPFPYFCLFLYCPIGNTTFLLISQFPNRTPPYDDDDVNRLMLDTSVVSSPLSTRPKTSNVSSNGPLLFSLSFSFFGLKTYKVSFHETPVVPPRHP